MPTSAPTPTTLLILGAGGDLTHRLLLPGLATLLRAERGRVVRVVGADQGEFTDDQWRARVTDSFASVRAPAAVRAAVLSTTRYQRTNILEPQSLQALITACGDGPLVVFFALPPAVTMACCALLRTISLPPVTRLALEKPFGTDLASAHRFNALLERVVPESDTYRIDHFLGVNTVLNLIGLRFANRFLQPIWSNEHIERVEIVYDEDLALEGRAGYYDHNGALKDMIQSHLLQVLSVFCMESVASLDAEELQGQKSQALRAMRLWSTPGKSARRARYTAGQIGSRPIPDYIHEDGVDPERMTETLAQVTLAVDNNRWAGVPFVLRSGKALGTPRKEIVVRFRDVAHLPRGFRGCSSPDQLVISLKPGGIALTLTMNAEGDAFDLEQKTLSAALSPPQMQPYGEILGQILDGSQMLTVRGDAAEDCWRVVEPVLRAFAANRVRMETYAAGSAGPAGWLAP